MKITLLFLVVNCLTWLILGVLIVTETHPAIPDQPVVKWIMASSSLVAACIFFVLSLLIYRRNKAGYYLTILALVITALLLFFDDFGISDLIFLAVSLIPVVLLIKDHARYLQPASG